MYLYLTFNLVFVILCFFLVIWSETFCQNIVQFYPPKRCQNSDLSVESCCTFYLNVFKLIFPFSFLFVLIQWTYELFIVHWRTEVCNRCLTHLSVYHFLLTFNLHCWGDFWPKSFILFLFQKNISFYRSILYEQR